MHKLGVGRERHGLRLHRRIDDHLGEIRRLGRAGARGDVQALLNQRHELVLAHALAPARQRRAVEGQLVLEELLAAEQLEIGVLQPTLAQRLVREIVCVLQDRQGRHQPGRKRRLARFVGIDRAEPLFQKPPVDLTPEPGQRVIGIDDLVETGAKHIRPPAVSTFLRPHQRSPIRPSTTRESRFAAQLNLQENQSTDRQIRQSRILAEPRKPMKSGRLRILHGRLISFRLSKAPPTVNFPVRSRPPSGAQSKPRWHQF
jgi:hypothetical protein